MSAMSERQAQIDDAAAAPGAAQSSEVEPAAAAATAHLTLHGASTTDAEARAAQLTALARERFQERKLAEAEPLFREALDIRERIHGPDHPLVIQSINNLAALHVARGDLAPAEPLLQRALQVGHLKLDSP